MLEITLGAMAVLIMLALTAAVVAWRRLTDVEDDPVWQALAEQEPRRLPRR
ncbi:MAG TPA: hypothetical protein VGN96_03010 [Roseococcus sp.]|jgi:hypothetical protein|nr:hypothetical protein [Roseococcus sp.]